jgi:hypothetical protein
MEIFGIVDENEEGDEDEEGSEEIFFKDEL